MNCSDWAKKLLLGDTVEEKLLFTKLDYIQGPVTKESFKPGRDIGIQFSSEKIKFPKGQTLKSKQNTAKALHFFANHELQAIEAMAMAILKFPMNEVELRDLTITICEEQKHFKLYQKRMRELECEFGDYPLNDFFWKYFEKVQSLSEFHALMGLTFEAANLDFAEYYRALFLEVGDTETASIMKTVLEDEIKHVAKGLKSFQNHSFNEEELWNSYCQALPKTITPARAKGVKFNKEARLKAGMSEELIEKFCDYQDNYPITSRKEWKTL